MASHTHAMIVEHIRDIEKIWIDAVRQLVQGSYEIVLPAQSYDQGDLADAIASRFGTAVHGKCTVVHDTVNDVIRILPPPNTIIPRDYLRSLLPAGDPDSVSSAAGSFFQPAGMAGFEHTVTAPLNDGSLTQPAAVTSDPSIEQLASEGYVDMGNHYFTTNLFAQAPSFSASASGQPAPATLFAYGTPMGYTSTAPSLPDTNTNTSDQAAPATTKAAKRKSKGIPRPQNCWLLFRGHWHPHIMAQNPGIHNNEVSVIISQKWKALDENGKNYWRAKAKEVKQKHAEEHPHYVYKPRKPSQIKSRRKKFQASTDPSFVTFDFTPTVAGRQEFEYAFSEHNRTNQLGALPLSQHGAMFTHLGVCGNEYQCQDFEQHFHLSALEQQAEAVDGGFGSAMKVPGNGRANAAFPYHGSFLGMADDDLDSASWVQEQGLQVETTRQPEFDSVFEDFEFCI